MRKVEEDRGAGVDIPSTERLEKGTGVPYSWTFDSDPYFKKLEGKIIVNMCRLSRLQETSFQCGKNARGLGLKCIDLKLSALPVLFFISF